MQLTRQKHRLVTAKLHMVAMIDIVFLLLIFFMCTTTFARPEEDLPTQLPAESPAESLLDDFDPVLIELSRVDGRVRLQCDGQVCGDDRELGAMLRARRAIADVPVIIRGGGEVPFGDMVHVLDLCYHLGLHRVAYYPVK